VTAPCPACGSKLGTCPACGCGEGPVEPGCIHADTSRREKWLAAQKKEETVLVTIYGSQVVGVQRDAGCVTVRTHTDTVCLDARAAQLVGRYCMPLAEITEAITAPRGQADMLTEGDVEDRA
jgi:hypothetical protein